MPPVRSPVALAPVIGTKLTPPQLPGVFVGRAELREVLATGARVLSVVAPAGYGKTLLVRDWLEWSAAGGRACWYSLDALDANPLCFWRHLLAALAGAVELSEEPDAVLLDRGADDPSFLHALLHDLLRAGDPVVVVLDDLHLLRDRRALDHLALLVDRTPGHFRLAFTARSDPGLPLARWRAQGWLTEIRERDLRFDQAATTSLLHAYGYHSLDTGAVAELVARTEGWVTGLQLALLSRPAGGAVDALQEVEVRGRLISGYLVNEVLDRLPDEQRETALALSVLEQFDVDLAVALTDRPDAGAIVHALLRRQRVRGPDR
jgi:LuxR family transcriptional regulator, maltose regulon positive regulatory protein